MIKFVLMVNKQGQTRLAQYYDFLSIQERVALEAEIIRKCLGRNETQCSFVEYRGYKVIYRRYASLFFIVGVKDDDSENELGILEFIHALVETMDKYFESVCELDIMFNLEKAHFILDEMVMNGYIVETNKISILKPIHLMEKASQVSTQFQAVPKRGHDGGIWTTVDEHSWASAEIPARGAEAGKIDVVSVSVSELPAKRADAMPAAFEEETVRKKKLTSVVWETFTPISSSGLRDGLIDSAKCSVCNKIFSTRHGTSSMMRHAKRHNEFPNGTPTGKRGKKSANAAAANGAAAAVAVGKKPATVQKKETVVVQLDEHAAGLKRQRLRNLSSALIEWVVEDQQDLGVLQHEKFLDVLAVAGIKPVIPPLDALQKAMERKYYALFARVDKAAKKTFLREMLRTNVYDSLSDARLDEDQARHDASAAYTTFEKLLDIGEGMPDYTIDGDEANYARALNADVMETTKLFKFNELARAWQIERQNFGRKRRRDSFDYLDPPLEPPAKLASYEESI
ncbi:hypothetical protein PF005_g1261 [Phytophthora fragariae]|nr:hypothetical protein PF003_g20628 [Phytophthora fragariae]KAE9031369.1 hypothetical protein PF011_g157 [Phytophthora fragariae]KAE9155660.1 hypothetical protein PF006_g402 [Phytophthora fragariae]KAE9235952.1 hypothetical protein PF005_g1261 [Phytophthora fragariae]KAE9255937.1 hypothetical protein PF004_g337 [Phytophthora fragariae]